MGNAEGTTCNASGEQAMKVALVYRFFCRAGAVPTVAREWADHLEAAGHEVVVLASDVRADEGTRLRTYVPVRVGRWRTFDLGGWVFALGVLVALWRHRRRPPDIVLCIDSTAYFGVWAAGRLLRRPTIMAFQGWVYSQGKLGLYPRTVAWAYRLSVHFCARAAPLVACISREIYDGLLRCGARPERLWLAPNCVDLELWRTDKIDAHARDERQALFVGRFSPEKGLRYLMEAIPSVAARLPGVRVLLVGSDEGEDGEFHAMARRLGVTDAVEFGGLVERATLPAIYAAADVLVVPSLAEGHPLAPIECLACGTPVIASDIPGLNETISEGENGLLVPARDAGALADAMCRVLGDEELLGRLTRAARPSVVRFAWEPRVGELAELCAELRRRRSG